MHESARLRLRVPAVPSEVATVRHAVVQTATAHGIDGRPSAGHRARRLGGLLQRRRCTPTATRPRPARSRSTPIATTASSSWSSATRGSAWPRARTAPVWGSASGSSPASRSAWRSGAGSPRARWSRWSSAPGAGERLVEELGRGEDEDLTDHVGVLLVAPDMKPIHPAPGGVLDDLFSKRSRITSWNAMRWRITVVAVAALSSSVCSTRVKPPRSRQTTRSSWHVGLRLRPGRARSTP